MKKFTIVILFLIPFALSAQQKDSLKYITITPGPEYEAGGIHRFFYGSHWRDLWTTSIKVPVLDLENFAGGLTPIRRGGGLQTKSLRLRGGDGQEWKFRSVNKDPTAILSDDLKSSVIADMLKDQISTANPVGALAVVPLLNAVGVLHAPPFLFYLDDDPKLGKFREEFGGILGMIEVHPDQKDSINPGFKDAEKVVGTYKLLRRLEEKRSEKIEAKEFLKARLMDCFIGDWDRHTDQWRWARYTHSDGVEYWHPIPRDRDNAFVKYTGLLPTIAEMVVPQLHSFDYKYPPAKYMTWSGRYIDKRFLSEITKPEWDSVANFVHSKLTDELIENCVYEFPEEYIKLSKDEIISKLKARRDALLKFSEEYYIHTNKVVEIFGSVKKDYAEVKRLNDELTEVSLYRMKTKSKKKRGKPFYHKVFDNSITKEIRIHLQEGDDYAIVKGEVEESPLIRVIGGSGEDELVDSSLVHGFAISFIPILVAETMTRFYDSDKNTKIVETGSTSTDRSKVEQSDIDEIRFEPQYTQRGTELEINPEYGFSSDDGFLLGAGPSYFGYNFRNYPYEYWLTATASYASFPGSYRLYFEGKFNSMISGATVTFIAQKNELSFNKYFGYGNETPFTETLEEQDFFKVEQEVINLETNISFPVFKNNTTTFGISYNDNESIPLNKTALQTFKFPDYALDDFTTLSFNSKFVIDTRDYPRNAYTGSYFELDTKVYPAIFDNEETFASTSIDIRNFNTFNFISRTTIALRAGAEKIWGDKYPFFHAAFLGGKEKLRGFSRERFSGHTAIFAQAEARMSLGRATLLLPGELGIHAFTESGRVFIENDDSKRMHVTFGGGFWFAILDRALNFSLTFAHSPEKTAFYIRSRLGF